MKVFFNGEVQAMRKKGISGMEIGNKLKYNVASAAGAFMHLTFLVIFICIDLHTLICFNVFSVTLYVLMWVLCRRDSFERHSFVWITVMFFEISVHAVLSTIFLGGESCFYFYMMTMIPVVIYFLFLACPGKFVKLGTVVSTVVSVVLLIFVLLFVHYNEPLYYWLHRPLQSSEIEIMRAINVFFNLVLLVGFSLMFILEINTLIKRLNYTNDQLNYIATHDALTGLFNRYCISGTLNGLSGSGEEFCLVMGDLDDFKKINDIYGHDCGDIVLKSVAEIIMKNIRKGDTACRWGGEEILIIIKGTYDECYPVVSKIREEINSIGLVYSGKPVNVSMTFGFTTNTEDSFENIDQLISVADKRLYKGKASGKNIIISED